MIAPFRNLEVGVVLWRQPNAVRRDEVGKRIMRFRQMSVHRLHDLIGSMRAGDRQHSGMLTGNQTIPRSKATGYDDLAVLPQGLADGIQ